jgi:hypothetical protein
MQQANHNSRSFFDVQRTLSHSTGDKNLDINGVFTKNRTLVVAAELRPREITP